ncbi:MAG: HAD family phosphatase [Roseibium sp.]|nr:HAD family phosphatase [Roseibium sp.]
MPADPKYIIFDVGNVLIHWDPEHLYRTLIPDDQKRRRFLTEVCSMAWNLEQDLGRPWRDAVAILSAQHPAETDLIRAYDERWHEMVPGAIQGSVTILAELKRTGVPLYAITNFSTEKYAEAQTRFPFLAHSFIDTVVSGAVGLIKPDPAIFQLLLDRNGLDPRQCVFIDDSLKNITAARALGLTGHHFTGPDALAEDLRGLGFPVG